MTTRKNTHLFIAIPPEEKLALIDFAETVNRPLSWVVRDALKAYIETVTGDKRAMDAMRANLVDPGTVGRTPGRKPRI